MAHQLAFRYPTSSSLKASIYTSGRPSPAISLHGAGILAKLKRLPGAPSTFYLTLPEVYLDTPEEQACIQSIRKTMRVYGAGHLRNLRWNDLR